MIEYTNEENHLIDDCLKLIIPLIRDAGTIAIDGYNQIVKKIEMKQPGNWDVVTEFDVRIENFLIDGIRNKYSNHKFIGEETFTNKTFLLTDDPTWIIDPIDGTNSFVHGLPYFAVSIAMTLKKKLCIGIVYNPILKELYSARLGAGAFLNDSPIKCSNIENLNESLYCDELSFLIHDQYRKQHIKRTYKLASTCPGSRSFGCGALTLAYIARGSVDCYQIDHMAPWDVAGGVLLVTEAGGHVSNSDGTEFNLITPKLVAAATDKLLQQMLTAIREADKWNNLNDFNAIQIEE